MLKRILAGLLLIAYIFILFKILVFKEVPLVRIGHLMLNFGGTQDGPANLIPFKTILPYLLGKNGLLIAALNIGGNIILFLPIGFLLPTLFSRISWIKIISIAIATGIIVEGIQAILHIGIFDIDDVILNGLGLILGFWAYGIFTNFSIITKKVITISTGLLTVGIVLIYIIAAYKQIQLPFSLEPAIEREHLNNRQVGSTQCCDPCNGTGGTGEIIAISINTITIKGRKENGSSQVIKLTEKTIIKNAEGPILANTLKMGDHVTVVIDETETASLVLVCGLIKPSLKH